MPIKYFILLLTLLIWDIGVCQKKSNSKDEDASLEKHAKETPSNLAFAKFEINDIKKRGIIIQLKTNKDRIAAYRKAGNIKVADQMERNARETNYSLMDAFICHWTYCPVYFMESQHTIKLLREDTLIAKTYDLERDTAIYMNADSFYLIDYGTLMENEPPGENTDFKDLNKTEQSDNPVSDGCLVVKNNKLKQLQYPFPYFTKVSLINMNGFSNSNGVNIIIFSLIQETQLMRLSRRSNRTREQNDTITNLFTASFNYIIQYHSQNKYEKSAMRLNNKFIDYYCKRLDKDRDILCNDDPYYWWQKNPNIPYIAALPKLERELKINTYEEPTFTK
jgi:hypothetical protein